MQLLFQPSASLQTRHSMIASMQININHCRVWLFHNEMGAVAQCPNNWGVGSAFHPKKIHILLKVVKIVDHPVLAKFLPPFHPFPYHSSSMRKLLKFWTNMWRLICDQISFAYWKEIALLKINWNQILLLYFFHIVFINCGSLKICMLFITRTAIS